MMNQKLVPFILITYSSNLFAHDHVALSVQYTDVLALALMALAVLLATVAVAIQRIYRVYPAENDTSTNKSTFIPKENQSALDRSTFLYKNFQFKRGHAD